jgi:O-succinylhomoserine sulfhydrylase
LQDGRGNCWFAFASGMAAVYSTMAALLKSGDHIVLPVVFLAATFVVYQLFSKWNIETSLLISISQKLLKVSSTPNTKRFCRNRLQIQQSIL